MSETSNFSIPLNDLETFNRLIKEYLNANDDLKELYGLRPELASFEQQIQRKSVFQFRRELVKELGHQHRKLNLTPKQKENLENLSSEDGFTVCTGHQLNLFTGPLYFVVKIVDTIRLADYLKQRHPENHFVPIFWMATEDHDFQEINHFYWQNKKHVWIPNQTTYGPVGRISTDGIMDFFNPIFNEVRVPDKRQAIQRILELSYGESNNLADATRRLCHLLFKDYGLLILDGDSRALKESFKSVLKKEIQEGFVEKNVQKSSELLQSSGQKIQVNPRSVNLFQITDAKRERIIRRKNTFTTIGKQGINEDQILRIVDNYPEEFSPNALLRPIYQEWVLPNLAYIGGAGELSYWLQLKSTFQELKLAFPILLPRNSLFVVSQNWPLKMHKLQLEPEDFLNPEHKAIDKIVGRLGMNDDFFDVYIKQLNSIFDGLEIKAAETDRTFINMVNAQRKKQLNGFEKMKKRWWKAEKINNKKTIEQYEQMRNQLWIQGGWQERKANFFDLFDGDYPVHLEKIYQQLQPLTFRAEFLLNSD